MSIRTTVPSSRLKSAAVFCAALWLAACGSSPKLPDWQFEAKASMERSINAYMQGNMRVEAAELARARSQLSRSGRIDLLATAELLHCASRVASLVFEPCESFEKLRQDSTPAQKAYADYLRSRVELQSLALLTEPQRAVAAGNAGVLTAIKDPLSQLVSAGILLQAGKATPEVIAMAVETASAQGWRRPLLTWLGVQARLAEQAGNNEESAKLQRRIAIIRENGLSSIERP